MGNRPSGGDAASKPQTVEWDWDGQELATWCPLAGKEVESMPTTAWRFSGTEGADEAVLKLEHLEAAKLVEVQDVTVIRCRSTRRIPRCAST